MKINILSLYDGIGCGYLALKAAGFDIESYTASEIEKAAIKIAAKNIPMYKNIGDVRKVLGNHYYWIDLLIGGSPCQGFSVAGKRKGMVMKNILITTLEQYKEIIRDGYVFDLTKGKNQSVLFWEFIRIREEINRVRAILGLPPVYFLLENVKMYKPFWKKIINEALGCEPVNINSKCVVPQNRDRSYWTNIPVTELENLKPTLNTIIPDAVTGAGWSGRQQNGSLKYTPYLTFRKDNIANCVTTWNPTDTIKGRAHYLNTKGQIKPFTMEHLEALQGYPIGYTAGVPDKDRRKAIGNGWTIPVIQHIFECLKNEFETIEMSSVTNNNMTL